MQEGRGKTYYELLGLEPDATLEQIKEAYREIARVFHPDSNFYDEIIEEELPDQDDSLFKEITNAYQVLINADKRRAYDDSLPADLEGWDDNDEGVATTPQENGARPRRRTEDIPEEWRKEREYFEEHYYEILKPAPKTNLVGGESEEDSGHPSLEDWEPQATVIGSHFGEVDPALSDDEFTEKVAPTRRAVSSGAIFRRDPLWLIAYLGIPLLLAIVVLEIYLLR